ncbi:hypothetical protein [Actinoplanes sp. NPDC051494]|uniref:hypothetical protein n=1 Tax=Actinoplanes sp. NPDC051494 TaxID=3363907 RepID=UPI0037AF6933
MPADGESGPVDPSQPSWSSRSSSLGSGPDSLDGGVLESSGSPLGSGSSEGGAELGEEELGAGELGAAELGEGDGSDDTGSSSGVDGGGLVRDFAGAAFGRDAGGATVRGSEWMTSTGSDGVSPAPVPPSGPMISFCCTVVTAGGRCRV